MVYMFLFDIKYSISINNLSNINRTNLWKYSPDLIYGTVFTTFHFAENSMQLQYVVVKLSKIQWKTCNYNLA